MDINVAVLMSVNVLLFIILPSLKPITSLFVINIAVASINEFVGLLYVMVDQLSPPFVDLKKYDSPAMYISVSLTI